MAGDVVLYEWRREMIKEALQKPHDWEEAYNQLTDEKDALWRMLSEVVDLWETDAPKHELENAMSKARHVVELTEVEGK